MLQQFLAIGIIIFLASRVFWQKKKKQITGSEFLFWLAFWFLAALAVIFLKQIDRFVAYLGFSSNGINFLLYVSVMVLFYLIFRLRIRLEKQEKNITKIIREIAIKEK